MFKVLPIYPIFILILIISSNYLTELFPCRLRDLLTNNIYIKHLFGFLTLLFFISITISNIGSNVIELLKNSFILYLYFVLLTKNNKYFFIIICVILAVIYLGQIEINLLNKKENKSENEKLFLKIYDKRQNTFGIENILHYTIILLLVLGALVYMGEKKLEYKKKFKYLIFLLGKPICKEKSININIKTALKHAFN